MLQTPFHSSQCPLSDSMHNPKMILVAKWSLFSSIVTYYRQLKTFINHISISFTLFFIARKYFSKSPCLTYSSTKRKGSLTVTHPTMFTTNRLNSFSDSDTLFIRSISLRKDNFSELEALARVIQLAITSKKYKVTYLLAFRTK